MDSTQIQRSAEGAVGGEGEGWRATLARRQTGRGGKEGVLFASGRVWASVRRAHLSQLFTRPVFVGPGPCAGERGLTHARPRPCLRLRT